jgi:hypothetical protein
MEAQADRPGGFDLDGEQVAGAAWEDVVVVGRRRAARAGQGGQRGAGGGVDGGRVDVRPDGVQGDQPLEQRAVLDEAARGRLVEVVVAVDQAGRGQRAAAVDAPGAVAQRVGGGARADGDEPTVLAGDVAVGVLAARVIDRGDRAALDHRATHARSSAAARSTASTILP